MRKPSIAAAAIALVAAPLLVTSQASAAVPSNLFVNFTGETAGAKADGYATAAQPDVHFADTTLNNLSVGDQGVQTHGLAIIAGGIGNNALEIRLTNPTNNISMDFGNDDGGIVDATAQARLTAFRGATKVGQTLKNVNANDVMDQRISFGSHLFNRVVFQYVDAAENPTNLAEMVDDIEITPLCTVIGTTSNDQLAGTVGSDVICGDEGFDTIDALGGDDLVYGAGGNDTVRGGNGNDVLIGGQNRDKLFGQAGNDVLNGAKKRDRCDGGPGFDTAVSCEVKVGFP